MVELLVVALGQACADAVIGGIDGLLDPLLDRIIIAAARVDHGSDADDGAIDASDRGLEGALALLLSQRDQGRGGGGVIRICLVDLNFFILIDHAATHIVRAPEIRIVGRKVIGRCLRGRVS